MTRIYLIGFIYILSITNLLAQGVSKVRAEQSGADAIIQYDLSGSGDYFVSLY